MVIQLKNLKYDKTQKLKLWQNSKTKIGKKNPSCNKTQQL